MKCNIFQKGIMLMSVLMLTTLLLMLTVSMTVIITESYNSTANIDKKAKALKAAEAGIEYAFYQLNSNSTWGSSITSDITQSISSDQKFNLVFDSSSNPRSSNNLKNPVKSGAAPAYSADIISEGIYFNGAEVRKVKMRCIFVRDDVTPYPAYTEGNMFIGLWGGFSPVTFQVAGLDFINTSNPGRLHTNSNFYIWGNSTGILNLNDGFVSSGKTVEVRDWPAGTIKTKEDVSPVKIPDINVSDIINPMPSGFHAVTSDKFYLLGYFEYDPTVPYCVPHASPNTETWDPNVNVPPPYKLGILSFDETDGKAFVDKYGKFFYTGANPSSLPGSPTRNFLTKYPSATFWEYGTPAFATNLSSALGMTMNVDTTNPSNILIDLNMNDNLYIQSTLGLFLTGKYGASNYYSLYDLYYPNQITKTTVKLNMNNHKIYGKKLYLAIPPSGNGEIISDETIDIACAYDCNMDILSAKSISMGLWVSDNQTINYNGIMYAKDDILIKSSNVAWGTLINNTELNIKGALISEDEDPSNTQYSLMTPFQSIFFKRSSLYLDTSDTFKINLYHNYNGLSNLVNLRGNDFKVRKMLSEILK